MTTAALIALTEEVAERLTASGVPSLCDVVEGDPYVRLHLTHDGTAVAWVPLSDCTWAIVRDQPGTPCRIDQNGPLERGSAACSEVECLMLVVWEFALRWRARTVA